MCMYCMFTYRTTRQQPYMTAQRLTCLQHVCTGGGGCWRGGHMNAGKQKPERDRGQWGCSLQAHSGFMLPVAIQIIELFRTVPANQGGPLLWAAELGISLHLLVAASQCPLSIAPSHCYVTVAGILWKEGGVVDWWLLAGEESIDGKQMVAMVSSFLSPSSPAPPNYPFFFLFGWTLSWEDFKCLLFDLAPMIVHSAVQEMCVWKVSLEGKLGRARRNVTPMWVRGNKTAWPFCWLFSLAPWESTFSHTKRSG